MPIHKAGNGVQWGSHGKVYHGPRAREKAEKQAAAAHANGYRGDTTQAHCAGILFIRGNDVLLLHRTDRDEWEGPGGHIENGETPVQAALRECAEETGLKLNTEPEELAHVTTKGVDYTTYLVDVDVDEDLPITLNHEHDRAEWFHVEQLPETTHPGVTNALGQIRSDSKDQPSEFDIIEKLARGELQSPVRFGPLWLFAMRVTGTGIAYRPQLKEWVYRPPRYYLTDEFLERVKGLPILMCHAEEGPVAGDEFHDRSIGVLVSPWLTGTKENDEVWGIGKIYDDADAALIVEQFPSTSPSVSFGPGVGKMEQLEDGTHLLIEGPPQYIDHLAVVTEGVWDKYDGPSGINLSAIGERNDGRNATGALAPYSWRR